MFKLLIVHALINHLSVCDPTTQQDEGNLKNEGIQNVQISSMGN